MRDVVLIALLLVLIPAGPAEADRSLPTHGSYHADRSLTAAKRAWAAGFFERAETLAVETVRLDRNSASGWALLVETRLALGRTAGALEAATDLRRTAPADVDAALLCARAHVEAGDRSAALDVLLVAAREAPSDGRVEMARALVEARLSKDWEAMKTHLRSARSLDPTLPDATLPLQAAWAPLAEDEAFLAAFTEVLRDEP